jgi:hypothetical protein
MATTIYQYRLQGRYLSSTHKSDIRAWHYFVHTCDRKYFKIPTLLPSTNVQHYVLLYSVFGYLGELTHVI